ncbi:MAG: endonuclease [Crocinitomicaceae bacterium]|nr:endonuclease [Crocinitomicaceae bacterium]
MKKLLLSIAAFSFGISVIAQTDIADARTFGIGQTVTVTGIATNGSELGSIRYMQDNSAGIAGYGGPITGANRGDSITITGPLIEFAGLLEISTVATMVNHGQAIVQPTPLQIPILAADETLESQLVQMDNVTFVQTGSFAGGNSTVQITDGTNTFDVRVNGSTDIAGTAIPTGAVTLVGALGQYNASYQLVPRDLQDIIPYVAPSEEINVLVNGATVLNGGTYFVGNSTSTPIVIENTGSNGLSVTGATFTGADAAAFSSDIVAGVVGASSTGAYTLTFVPTTNGSKFATLEIGSNDSDENPYVIYLEGVGVDGFATEPTANPTGLTFPLLEAYTLGGQYNPGVGATDYLVLWKSGSPITGVPVDGNTYLRGDIVGDARVAYMGAGTSFTPRGVVANQDYYFAVYAFNGSGGFENYLTTAPLTGNVTSTGEQIGSYYDGIDKTAGTFNDDLNALINPHTFITYFLYKQTMMSEFEIKDTTNGQSYVECALSGERMIFNDPFDWVATGYSREHTLPHSWMATFPADSPEQPEYTDQHNLYPANLAQANSPRSNLPLGDVVPGTEVFTYLGGSVGDDASGQTVYEPRDEHKGNAARAIMYTIVAYDFPLNGNAASDNQSQEVLKAWHFADLPDNYEIARHEYIYDLQGNRNPFIDSTDYACYVDFFANTHDADGCLANITEQLEANFVVYPVPSSDLVHVQINGVEINGYEITDLQGRIVLSEEGVNLPKISINGKTLGAGTYFVIIQTPFGEAKRKMIIE